MKSKAPILQKHNTKICSSCNKNISLSDYHKDKSKKDGHSSTCKTCAKARTKAWRENNPERCKLRDRQWFLNNKESVYKNVKRYSEANPKKVQAKIDLNNAVLMGKLVRPNNCEVCGSIGKIHGHHCDYSKPLNVMWLCQKCHITWHKTHGEGLNAQ